MKTPLTVILLVHNEEDTIRRDILNYYHEIVQKIPGTEFILAEDGSTDKTKEIILSLKKQYHLIFDNTKSKIGYGNSLKNALQRARGAWVFYSDAGGKHSPKDFWKLYKLRNSFEVLSGLKTKRYDPWYRLFLAWGLNKIVNLYFHVPFHDIDCGFKLLSRKAVNHVLDDWILKRNVSMEIVLRAVYAGCKAKEVDIRHYARKFGSSRGFTPDKIIEAVWELRKFSRLKLVLNTKKRLFEHLLMIKEYNNYFPTKKYRLIWDGIISERYKFPKYLNIIRSIINQAHPFSVLEVGCGDGEVAVNLLSDNTFIKRYCAVEKAQEGVRAARSRLKKFKQAEVYEMDAEKLEFKNKAFDVVFCVDVMHHVLHPQKMAEEMLRLAKKKIFLLEANRLSLAKILAEQQLRYKKMGEFSYFPWEYQNFFKNLGVKKISLKPFLFIFSHCPKSLIPLNIFISETLEKIPLLNWQCSSVLIEIEV